MYEKTQLSAAIRNTDYSVLSLRDWISFPIDSRTSIGQAWLAGLTKPSESLEKPRLFQDRRQEERGIPGRSTNGMTVYNKQTGGSRVWPKVDPSNHIELIQDHSSKRHETKCNPFCG